MRPSAVLLALLLILPCMVMAPGAEGQQQSQVSILFVEPVYGNYAVSEGEMMEFTITLFVSVFYNPALLHVLANLSAYSRGQKIWEDSVTLVNGVQNVTANFTASYGMSNIVFTGTYGHGEIIPPSILDIQIIPGIKIDFAGSNPPEPREQEDAVLHFNLTNTMPYPIQNATVVLYKINPLAGYMGEDVEAKEIGRLENVTIATGDMLNVSIPWDSTDWGTHQMIVVLTADSNGLPYVVQKSFTFSVEDLEESPLPALTAFLMILLYFPLAAFLFAILFSRKTKRAGGEKQETGDS